jgi:N-acyl-phosphatidylethanolamine-hydrolysing phospholipase D
MLITWLGHASVLAQFNGWNVLSDPIFSERCSPVQWAGPCRLRPPPLLAHQLPRIDAIVISHNHYDHLDTQSVVDLNTHHPDAMWFVPLGMKEWFDATGVYNVVEMDWSETIDLPNDSPSKERSPLTITCVPCQHWCARSLLDRNKCLWSSWVLKVQGGGSFFFGGDTGYCPIFKLIGNEFSDISVAAIPIGAYGAPFEAWFHAPNHMNPRVRLVISIL